MCAKIICLGRLFSGEEERREYFRNELRKKLPDLKNIDGFPIGEDEDIIELSDPPYYTVCPNPWLQEIVKEWEKEKENIKNRRKDFEMHEPYSSDVSEGKYDPIYLYHPYPTKVPHKAIMKYILYYTQPGDIIFDGFAGTGMTGVASQQCGNPDQVYRTMIEKEFKDQGIHLPIWGNRKTICGDLSPLASFIAYNYNSPDEQIENDDDINTILQEVEKECIWMYETCHLNGKKGLINYTIWSDVFICPNCNNELVFWDVAVDKNAGKVKDNFKCPSCKKLHTKDSLEKAFITTYDRALKKSISQTKISPVLINYSFSGKRYEKIPESSDIELIQKINDLKIPYFYPTDRMPDGDESRRNDNSGITHVHHFYSMRNLYTLAKLKDRCSSNKFNILLTKVAFQITKLYRLTYQSGVWGAGGGPLSGTLYVPSLIKELNVLKQLNEAVERKKKLQISNKLGGAICTLLSNTSIPNIDNESVDYIFTDPPFGSNLMYSELNYLAESWLKIKTNNRSEAIQNKTQGKDLLTYQELMTNCFKENFRILKPGKWMTVEFSNTSAAVWNCIQTSLQRVGFVIANVSALDKQKGSFKVVTTPTAVKQDLVISCYKPTKEFVNRFKISTTETSIWEFISEHLKHLPIHLQRSNKTAAIIERSPRILYDRLVKYFFMKGLVPIDSVDFQQLLKQRFVERDGMYFTTEQAHIYDEKKAKYGEPEQISLVFEIIYSEDDAVQWLKERLRLGAQTYQEIMPDFRKANVATRKGEKDIELNTILEENFIQEKGGKWRNPDLNEIRDISLLKNKALLKEFDRYKADVTNQKIKKIKEVRAEALRIGFKTCWEKKDFSTIIQISERIPQNILLEDEQLLIYYDIAKDKI